MFRQLSPAEVLEFIQWARDNYVPGTPINRAWHPVVQDTCAMMTSESDPAHNHHPRVLEPIL